MLLPSHLVTGQTAYLAACLMFNHPPAPAEAPMALAGAIIPDLDCRTGLVGRLVPPVSGWLEHRFGHRTITHSLLLQTAVGALLWWVLPFGFFLALLAGWISHTFTDMMTPSGVAWFWPSRARCVLPGNDRYRMKAMGSGELIFVIIMGLAGTVFMHLARVEAGTAGLIRTAIGDMTAARQDYDSQKGGWRWKLKIEGRDNRTLADISGSYPVIGPYRDSGFILESAEGPASACQQESCGWYTSHAVLMRDGREQEHTRRIRANSLQAGELLTALQEWEKIGRVYLIGGFRAPGFRSAPPTVEASNEGVTLRYARPEVLEQRRGAMLRDVDLSAQLRYEGTQEPPELEVQAESDAILHPLLMKWTGKRQNLSETGFRTHTPHTFDLDQKHDL